MAAPDLDVIKDIPGYKVILKAVLKSQIQQLVEQLAATTEEESVILTASVADGTLSHLGSQSGKGFLEDHEDIKSQFLGFCLKKHHRDKQEKERLEAEAAINQARLEAARHTSPQGPYMSRSPRFSLPHGQRQVHPVALTRTPRGRGIRSPGNRHEPYPSVRPSRRSSTEPSPAGADSDSGQFIKIEPNLESSDNETSNQESSQAYAPSNSKSESGEHEDDVKSESSNSTIPNESQAEGLGLDSDLSNIISGSSQTQGGDSGGTDADVSVKMEAISESELELEITGVEPGRPSLQDNWDPNISMGMNFDPSQGATGNQADITGQGYSLVESLNSKDQFIRPKAGVYDKELALANGMVELVQGMGVYVRKDQFKNALNKGAPFVSTRAKGSKREAKRDGKRIGRYLLTVFFSQEELAKSSLFSSDQSLYPALNKEIVDAITVFSVCESDSGRGEILKAMRASLTSKRCKGRKTEKNIAT